MQVCKDLILFPGVTLGPIWAGPATSSLAEEKAYHYNRLSLSYLSTNKREALACWPCLETFSWDEL